MLSLNCVCVFFFKHLNVRGHWINPRYLLKLLVYSGLVQTPAGIIMESTASPLQVWLNPRLEPHSATRGHRQPPVPPLSWQQGEPPSPVALLLWGKPPSHLASQWSLWEEDYPRVEKTVSMPAASRASWGQTPETASSTAACLDRPNQARLVWLVARQPGQSAVPLTPVCWVWNLCQWPPQAPELKSPVAAAVKCLIEAQVQWTRPTERKRRREPRPRLWVLT